MVVSPARRVEQKINNVSPCGTFAFVVIVSLDEVAVLVTVAAAEYGVPIATQERLSTV